MLKPTREGHPELPVTNAGICKPMVKCPPPRHLLSLTRLLPLPPGVVQGLTANIEGISKVKVSLTKDLKAMAKKYVLQRKELEPKFVMS